LKLENSIVLSLKKYNLNRHRKNEN